MRRSTILRLLGLLFAFALVASACGSDDDDASDSAAADSAADDSAAADSAADDSAAASGDFLVDLGGREITVAIENAYLPFNYIDAETGEPGGWDYAALDEICSRLNCVPVYETFDWDPMIQAVSDGQFDLAADGITITPERAEIVDFSDGYISVDQRMLVAIDNTEITSEASLAASDCTVATQGGTTNAVTAERIVGADRLSLLEEFGFVIQAVISGDACAAIIDETAGQGYIGANADQLQLLGDSLSSDQLGFIFGLGSDLVAPFNEALASMKADGTLEEISGRYFGASFTISYDDLEFPEYEEAE